MCRVVAQQNQRLKRASWRLTMKPLSRRSSSPQCAVRRARGVMKNTGMYLIVVTLAGALTAAQSRPDGELGTIHFPTSATGAAQTAFLAGVKGLHNFEFD